MLLYICIMSDIEIIMHPSYVSLTLTRATILVKLDKLLKENFKTPTVPLPLHLILHRNSQNPFTSNMKMKYMLVIGRSQPDTVMQYTLAH